MNVNKQPNILFIMTDQEQAMVIDPDHPCITPNAEKMMKEGVVFDRAYTPMAHCCPARASLMTGLYPSRHGIFNNVQNGAAINRSLPNDCRLFSEYLKKAGYNLAYTGKWHVSATQNPGDYGWEELPLCSIGTYEHKDYDVFKYMKKEDNEPRQEGELIAPGWHRYMFFKTLDKDTKEIKDYTYLQSGIEKMKEFAKEDAPWSVFISLTGPHAPYRVPEKYVKLYNPDEIPLPPSYTDELLDRPQLYQRMRKKYSQFSEKEVKNSIAHYWGYCTMQDEMLGEALEALKETGQEENTLVVFLSDHGDFVGAHGLYAKGIPPFEEGYKIPMVMKWPAGIKNPGRKVDEFVTLADIAPTVTEVGKTESMNDLSGRSLVPFLKDESPKDWPDAFYSQCNGVEIYYTQRMVRTKEYKLVYNPSAIDELYDMVNDPYEMNNLINDPSMKKVLKELFMKIYRFGAKEEDYMSSYHTISHAEFGPAFTLGK